MNSLFYTVYFLSFFCISESVKPEFVHLQPVVVIYYEILPLLSSEQKGSLNHMQHKRNIKKKNSCQRLFLDDTKTHQDIEFILELLFCFY